MQINSKQILQMMDITEILPPDEFIKRFKDNQEFEEWALDCTLKKLKTYIIAFRSYELYEHCAIMQKLINNLK